jgi:hypothetical protein
MIIMQSKYLLLTKPLEKGVGQLLLLAATIDRYIHIFIPNTALFLYYLYINKVLAYVLSVHYLSLPKPAGAPRPPKMS